MTTLELNPIAPSAADPSARSERDPDGERATVGARRTWMHRLGRDLLYVLGAFPLAVVAFVVLVTGVSLAFGMLAAFLLGIPIGLATLYLARGFAEAQRVLLGWRGTAPPRAAYRKAQPGWRGFFPRFVDPQLWFDLLHGLVGFVVATVTFTVVTTWLFLMAGGLLWPFGVDMLDTGWDGVELPFGIALDSAPVSVAIGLVALLTLYPVVRGSAACQAWFATALLSNQSIPALQDRVEVLSRTRRDAVEAEAQALRRLERDVHDGPQQGLIRLQMDLELAQRRLETDAASAGPLLAEARLQLSEIIGELRSLTRGFAPPILTDRGLDAALATLAARSSVTATLESSLGDRRLPASVENAAYYVVSEALTNAAKHSGADAVRIHVELLGGVPGGAPGTLVVSVGDNGRGGADVAKGHGLRGLEQRVAAVDGVLRVDSPAGGPTVVTAELPCG